MSKKIYIPSLIIMFFAALVLLGPRLLAIDTVRSKVAAVVSAKSGWRIDAAQLDWLWLPTPHFSLRDTTLTKDGISLILPETRIFPLWRSLLLQKIELRAVDLIKPELRITSLAEDNIDQAPLSFPQTILKVKEGSVIFAKGLVEGQDQLFPLTISGITATIDSTTERSEFQLSSTSAYFNQMELRGAFTPADQGFKLEYEINGLQAHKLLPALGDGRLLPIASAISLQGQLSGNGPEQFEASVKGDFPCFVAPSATESFLLDCGTANVHLKKDAGGLTLNINKMQLKNPGLVLSGTIAKLGAANAAADPEPIWLVDLTGTQLDLSAIRKGVLALWGDHHLARTVCDIVLGGKAGQAAFYFKGPLADFRDIQRMRIKVDVEEAAIHPPATPLFLEKARGPIEINDGYLSGRGLSARLGNSNGDNCSLFLDLAARNHDFRLELDIDADVAALPEVLYDLIHHKGFRRELQRFTNVQGRAAGHLSIGETLDEPLVKVNVTSINGGAKYEPMAHPFRIRSGSFDISPISFTWQGIRGVVGPHMIRGTSGKISWDQGIFLDMTSAQATFDSAALLSDLTAASALPGKIAKTITKAEGIVELNSATMTGLINEPGNWQYSLDIATSGSRWTSPLLPQPILAERVRAKLSHNQIELVSGKIWFLEQPLLIAGSFAHKNFSDWRFWSTLSGTIREPLAEWIREKDWIPSRYFPIIPCTLDKLKVERDADTLKLSGGIAAGMGGITSPSVRLELESDRNHLKINELIVSSPAEQGHLTLEYLKNGNNRLNASWQGFIDAETVLALFNENILPAERLEGDFSVKYSLMPDDLNFTGWVKIHNLDWIFNKSRRDFLIRDLKITGRPNGAIMINQALIAAADAELNLNGQLTMASAKLTFDLGLEAEKLNSRTVNQIINDLKGMAARDEAQPERAGSFPEKQLQGVLHFKAEQFTSGPEDNQDEHTAPSRYRLSPANGFITIDSAAERYSLDLRDSRICGLDISGTLNARESNHESSLSLFTDSAAPPLFKEVIPCFGFENTLIDGPIHLDVNLKGMANSWQSGNADLYSNGGYIHRLGFLSKVLRVINLRDIFSGAGLPDFANKGFAYRKVDITSSVKDNKLHIKKAVIDGEGINVFGQGTIALADWSADLVVMLAPLKTVDAVITNIPLIGKVAGGKDKAVISIPVAVRGQLRNPAVSILPPEAIGEGLLNLVANTLMMPFRILSPLLPDTREK